jgi:hypothetical protein
MRHIFLYSFSVFIYTVALFGAGLFVGQALERARSTHQGIFGRAKPRLRDKVI